MTATVSAEQTMTIQRHAASFKEGNRVWSRTVSRPLSVSGACLVIYCDKGKCVQLNWSSILLDGYKKA